MSSLLDLNAYMKNINAYICIYIYLQYFLECSHIYNNILGFISICYFFSGDNKLKNSVLIPISTAEIISGVIISSDISANVKVEHCLLTQNDYDITLTFCDVCTGKRWYWRKESHK